jgi:hypothetical protein
MHFNFYSEFKFEIFFGAITVLSHCCWNIAAGKSTCVSEGKIRTGAGE